MKKHGLKRDTIDKFYTKHSTVELCIQLIQQTLSIDYEKDLIIEPSAGNGSFINSLSKLTKQTKYFDIQPEHCDIHTQDYLSLDTTNFLYNKIHIIGNPPFGRQSSTALKFIKKSCEFGDTISFILPKSFKKDSLQNKIPLYFHCVFQQDLPENSFLLNNLDYNVPCVFQIWVKQKTMRQLKKKLLPQNFKFVKKDEKPDIAFRRVGVYAGKIFTTTQDKSHQSHYFIKFTKKYNKNLLEKLKEIDYKNKGDTVGPKSISKQELIKEFNKLC